MENSETNLREACHVVSGEWPATKGIENIVGYYCAAVVVVELHNTMFKNRSMYNTGKKVR